MMRKLISCFALALLSICTASVSDAKSQTHSALVVHHGGAQPFLRDMKNMDQVGDLIDASLKKDPGGNAQISPSECSRTQSCITPRELFESLQQKHPNIGLTDINNLSAYIRGLVKVLNPPAGIRGVGRIVYVNGKRTLDFTYGREPLPGEGTWNDPNTGEEIAMGHCLNVIDLNFVGPIVVTARECGSIIMEARAGDEAIAFALLGNYAPDKCFSVAYLGMSVDRLGDTEIVRVPLPTHCPDSACRFDGFERATGLPITQSGGMSVKPGFYEVQVSRDFALNMGNIAVFCMNHGAGQHSCGIDVHQADYKHGRAHIYYRREDIPHDFTGRRLYWAMPGENNCQE